MAEIDWFNKPVENSRELILKEAFKLFLQKNVGKVGQFLSWSGSHFKDKLQRERYFFSSLNILYPISPDCIYSLKEIGIGNINA